MTQPPPTLTEQLRRPEAATLDIAEVVRLAQSGVLRVPKFQRGFVWDAEDVRKLFDSIWRGFPVGTFLFWRHPSDSGVSELGPLRLDVPARTDALWVVDGQQRVTSLVAVLTQPEVDDRFNLFFDLRRARFVSGGRGTPPATWLPLRQALETRTLLTWLREHAPDLEASDFDLADALGGALRDYRLSAYIVQGEDDLLLREVFDRVNSAGKPIGRSQVFHALFAGESDIGSPTTVVESLTRLGFGKLDPDRVLQSLLAIRGGNVARDVHDEFDAHEDVADWYELVERALERVIGYLQSQGVPHLTLLPSTLPIPVLAAFFHLHRDVDPWVEKLLSRWLWRGWTHGFGQQGQTPALRQAVRAIHPYKGEPAAAPKAYQAVATLLNYVPDQSAPVTLVHRIDTKTVVGRLGLLALASVTPRDADGNIIDLPQVLDLHGVKAISELVPKHRALFAARGFWPLNASRPTGYERDFVLQSHVVDERAASSLRDGDVTAFLSRRGALLQSLLRDYLDAKLEVNALIRPPLADLVVDDDEQ